MKEIELTQDQVAIVDDDDYEYLSQWKWYAHKRTRKNGDKFDARTRSGNKKILMHRLIMKVLQAEIEVDHINGNPLDNRKDNIRCCTRQENSRNSNSGRKNKFGYKGVTVQNKNIYAQIFDGKKHIFMSGFRTIEEAALSYDKKAIELFGDFAKLNFSEAE